MLQRSIILALLVIILLSVIRAKIYKTHTLNDLFRDLSYHKLDHNYFVQGPKCLIPNPAGGARNAYRTGDSSGLPKTCTNESDLVSVLYDQILQRYVLHINEPVAHELMNSSLRQYHCFYKNIVAGAVNDELDEVPFYQDFKVPLNVEGLQIECRTSDEPIKVLQRDVFALIQNQPEVSKTQDETKRKPSVIMFGIESISRLKLRSHFPMVHEYLKTQGWYEMQGYNRIGRTSFANMLATLSGMSEKTFTRNYCRNKSSNCLDKLPLIWKDFNDVNYLTAFAEEGSRGGTFSGFTKKPTDYYFRPFKHLEQNANCLGRRTNHSYIFDFSRQFMQRFLKHRPVWGLFWANYGDLHGESLQQEILRDLLDLESDGVFDHTIMIIFSADHCQDGHSKRKTDRAFLDHHLPMMFIYLPPWFRKKYPKYAQSLHLNQQRLSSNFDVYNTLKHIIQMGKESNGVYKKSRDCPTCQSLFINLPWDRSCEKAGIPRDDCACQSNKEVGTLNKSPPQIMDQINRYLMKNGLNQLEVRPKDGHELPLGSLLVDTINDYLSEQKLLDQCHYLRLNSSKILHQFKEPTSRFGLSSYRVKFSTDPGNAQFLTTVNYNNNLQKLEGLNVDHFSRLDDFITTTNCMVKLKQKLFCICKNRTAKNISNAADKVDEKRKLRRLEYEKAYNQIKYRNQMLAKKRRAQGMWIWRKKQSYKHKHVGKK